MFIVGVTGGIASGKSTVSAVFKEHNIPVIDADVIARLIVEPGQKAWKEIRKEFGEVVFKEDGQLDREALGKAIFSDKSKRVALNRITHPKIQRMMFWSVVKCFFEGHQFVVLDIPLLFETGAMLPYVHKIITVSCSQDTQIQRLMERNKYSEEEAKQRIKAQMSLEEKCSKSHFVIDNSATRGETRKQVEEILKYVRSSKQHVRVKIYFLLAALVAVTLLTLIFYMMLR